MTVSKLCAQTETTATLGGMVFIGELHEAVTGARVELRHAGTGDVIEARTNSAGQYLFTGLRVDDGYTLSVSASSYEAVAVPAFSLALGEERELDITLTASKTDTHHMERMVVVANREQAPPGTSTTLSERDIEEIPANDHTTINDYAALDPRITMLDSEEGEIAAAGQNVRYNSIQVDGIRVDDQFGLSTNGLPSLGNPFSMETIQSLSVDLAPYDVMRGGFTGVAINAVTKSGSNVFAGSAYYSFANEKFRAADPRTGARTPFNAQTYGFTLGGPIVRNHLFFFISWQRSTRTNPRKENGFEPDAASVARIAAIARDHYGFDAGVLVDPGERSRQADSYMAKLDWRITSQHRLSVRYAGAHGAQPVFSEYGGTTHTSLSSHWYTAAKNLDGWSAQLFSKWRDAFHTEVDFSQQRVANENTPNSVWPQVGINKIPSADGGDAGEVWIGPEPYYQVNSLITKNTHGRIGATWLLGKHRIELGGESVRSDFENTFLPYAWGSYSFASLDDFEAGKVSSYTYQATRGGVVPSVSWGYAVNTVFLQDTWRPISSLTLSAGVRYDYPTMSQKPRENLAFEQTFGMRNDGTIDGAYTIGPRFSFKWAPGRKQRMQIRGGAGIFQGRAPGSWLSNAFTEDGMTSYKITNRKSGQTFEPTATPRKLEDVINDPSIKVQMPVNVMSDGLHLPSIARGNLAMDLRLPWQKMTASLEWLYSQATNSFVYRDINLKQTTVGPDGRPLYGTWNVTTSKAGVTTISHETDSQLLHPEFSDVYVLTNADKSKDDSRASYLTFSLKRPVQNHWGASIAYTRGHATEVSPFTNSLAGPNFYRRISIDPNSDETGTASIEVRDRVLTTLTLKYAFVRKFDSTLQVIYDAHSGRPYSYSFTNDANGDGATNNNNDLFYVPSGRNDPKVYWTSQADQDAFFAYLATNDSLRRYAGQIAPRNSERSKFRHRVDLHFSQQIPFWRTLRAEVVCDILNFTNLLSSDWGDVYQYNAPYALPIAAGYYDPRTGQYAYSFKNTPKVQSLQSGVSRWQVQVGMRVRF